MRSETDIQHQLFQEFIAGAKRNAVFPMTADYLDDALDNEENMRLWNAAEEKEQQDG